MIGQPRVHHREVGSTNLVGRELAAAGAPNGTLVTADHQSAGRGRSDRAWEAPPRSSVLMSVVVRPADALLPLRAAVALCDVVSGAAIKWPNDVLVDGRKLAGILVEGRPQEGWAVLDALLMALSERIAQPAPSVLAAWGERDALLNKQIRWEPKGAGTAAGVDESGALLVDTEDGRVALDAGEVHLLSG